MALAGIGGGFRGFEPDPGLGRLKGVSGLTVSHRDLSL